MPNKESGKGGNTHIPYKTALPGVQQQPWNGSVVNTPPLGKQTPSVVTKGNQNKTKTKQQPKKDTQNRKTQEDYLKQIQKNYEQQIENAHSNDAIDAVVKDLNSQIRAADDRGKLRDVLIKLSKKAKKKQDNFNASVNGNTGKNRTNHTGDSNKKTALEINAERLEIQKNAKEKETNELVKMQQNITDAAIKGMDESLEKELEEIQNNKKKELESLDNWVDEIANNRKATSEKLWKAGNHKKDEKWENTEDGKKTDKQWRADVLSNEKISKVYNNRKNQINTQTANDISKVIEGFYAKYSNDKDSDKKLKLRIDIKSLENQRPYLLLVDYQYYTL